MPPDTAPSVTPDHSPVAPWDNVHFPSPRTLIPHHPAKAHFTLPAQEALVGCLRSAARAVLTRWHLSEDEQDSALLIVGELAANAAVHGRSEMSLRLVLAEGTLGIIVGDHGDPTSSHRPCAYDDPDEHGRGLDIVHTLSTQVDLHQDHHGTWILARLAVTATRPGTD
ncbi:ATP-binding protein [Streptomyces sp. NPDC058964]|uniref:ATP-binding protein n=1 Tax=Streptomyces sp. NPDC058964 TaxID=3346681 RepID=UPI0036A3AD18